MCKILEAANTRLSKTLTGRTLGSSVGGKCFEAYSKEEIRLRIQSRVRVVGHEIGGGGGGGGGGVKLLSVSEEDEEGCEVEEKKSSEEVVCGGGAVESGGSDDCCILSG